MLRFGPSGIPFATKQRTTEEGIRTCRKLGLDALELAFVQSVYLTPEKAAAVAKIAKAEDILLTCHAPYYINLNAKTPETFHASKNRLLSACRIIGLAGGWSTAVHAAYLMGEKEGAVTKKMIPVLKDLVKTLKDEGNAVWLRPEYAGKKSQWAGLEGLIQAAEAVEGILPCIDFGHLHAREDGKFNTAPEIRDVLTRLESRLGRFCLDNMHIQIAGIAYGPSGEKNHLELQKSDLNYQEILKVWKEFKLNGVVVTESPNQETDALLLQKLWKGKDPS